MPECTRYVHPLKTSGLLKINCGAAVVMTRFSAPDTRVHLLIYVHKSILGTCGLLPLIAACTYVISQLWPPRSPEDVVIMELLGNRGLSHQRWDEISYISTETI